MRGFIAAEPLEHIEIGNAQKVPRDVEPHVKQPGMGIRIPIRERRRWHHDR
jgi:hypothetical protein